MTGVDDPYEPPEAAEIVVRGGSVEEALSAIIAELEARGIID
jgi:adenylylsulfate kinase-like enzyme